MESLLPSEVARLVYGYLIEENCGEAAEKFLETSPHLKECLLVSKKGKKFHTKFEGKNLVAIFDILSQVKTKAQLLVAELPQNSTLYNKVFELLSLLSVEVSHCVPQENCIKDFLSNEIKSNNQRSELINITQPSSDINITLRKQCPEVVPSECLASYTLPSGEKQVNSKNETVLLSSESLKTRNVEKEIHNLYSDKQLDHESSITLSKDSLDNGSANSLSSNSLHCCVPDSTPSDVLSNCDKCPLSNHTPGNSLCCNNLDQITVNSSSSDNLNSNVALISKDNLDHDYASSQSTDPKDCNTVHSITNNIKDCSINNSPTKNHLDLTPSDISKKTIVCDESIIPLSPTVSSNPISNNELDNHSVNPKSSENISSEAVSLSCNDQLNYESADSPKCDEVSESAVNVPDDLVDCELVNYRPNEHLSQGSDTSNVNTSLSKTLEEVITIIENDAIPGDSDLEVIPCNSEKAEEVVITKKESTEPSSKRIRLISDDASNSDYDDDIVCITLDDVIDLDSEDTDNSSNSPNHLSNNSLVPTSSRTLQVDVPPAKQNPVEQDQSQKMRERNKRRKRNRKRNKLNGSILADLNAVKHVTMPGIAATHPFRGAALLKTPLTSLYGTSYIGGSPLSYIRPPPHPSQRRINPRSWLREVIPNSSPSQSTRVPLILNRHVIQTSSFGMMGPGGSVATPSGIHMVSEKVVTQMMSNRPGEQSSVSQSVLTNQTLVRPAIPLISVTRRGPFM